MTSIKIEKVVNEITLPLTPNTVSLVKKGSIVNSYITDNLGIAAYEINSFNKIALTGPLTLLKSTSLTPGAGQSIGSYLITDYDSNRVYNIAAIDGLIQRTGDTVHYVAPLTAGISGFIINDKVFNIEITEIVVTKPVITSPLYGATDISANLYATATAFGVLGASDSFESADWQVSDTIGFTNIVAEVIASTTNELDWSAFGLLESTVYYVRTRQKGVVLGYSEWSDPVSFTTAAVFGIMELSRSFSLFSAANDSFGMNVKMTRDGTKAFVMSLNSDNALLTTPGIVYTYNVVGNYLEYENSIQSDNAASNDFFGRAISVSDDCNTIAIAAPEADRGGNSNAGAVYVFTRSGIDWILQQEIISPTPGVGYEFGNSISISADGNTLLIGEPFGPGNAFIYTRTATVWTLLTTLNSSTSYPGTQFGYYVDLTADATRAVVGNYYGPGNCNAVFVNNAGVWSEESLLTTSNRFGNGFCVVINDAGDTIAIGSCYEDSLTLGSLAGAVYIFHRVGSTWTLNARLESDNPGDNEYFGSNIAIDLTGDKIIVGCRNDDVDTISNAGAAYIFKKVSNVWSQTDRIVPALTVLDGSFGFSLDMTPDGTLAIIGSNDDTNNVSKGGAVYLFSL